MSYSDSMHFSYKLSYKILCISSYRSKDMNFANFSYLQDFLEKQRKRGGGLFLPKGNSAQVADRWGQGEEVVLTG
jgi:hypothetical protein